MDAIEANSKKYEAISKKHDPYYPQMVKAIPIVRDFIVKRKLIIYGGTAIDYALRLFGDKIYPDDALEIPDLDFYSSNNVKDAFDLADELYKNGFHDTRVIRAIHLQTMRVDIGNKHWVADISYMPREIFEILPVLEYENMRIIHPDFQRMDLHNSLSYPFDNPPREVVFARWKKDITRFNLIDKYYPVAQAGASGLTATNSMFKISAFKTVSIPLWMSKFVFAGFVAYSLVYKSLEMLRESVNMASNGNYKIPSDILPGSFSISKKEQIKFNAPESLIEIVHINTEKAIKIINDTLPGKNTISHYEPTADFIPENFAIIPQSKDVAKIKIFKTHGHLVTSSSIEINYDDDPKENISLRFVSIQTLLKYFLAMRYFAPDHNMLYIRYYLSCMRIMEEAEKMVLELKKYLRDRDDGQKIINQIMFNSPFFLTTNVYGSDNASETYIVLLRGIELDLKLGLKPFPLPCGYKPSTGQRPADFNYSISEFYRRSGKLIEQNQNQPEQQ